MKTVVRRLATWRVGFIRLALFSVCVPALGGCAYHLGHGDRQIPGGQRNIAVPVFKNNTHDTGIETFFTNAFIRELQRAKIGAITDKANAQVTLEGVIDSVGYSADGQIPGGGPAPAGNGFPDGTVFTQVYHIIIDATLRLKRNSDQKIIWESSFQKRQPYRAPRLGSEDLSASNALYNHSARYQNIENMAQEMMSEAHDRLTENF